MTAAAAIDAGDATADAPAGGGRTLPGAGLVAAMVLMGSTATAGLFWFWHTRTAEFGPLADAIAAALPGSSPRVEGGRRRTDAEVPLLSVMLTVDHPPGDSRTPPPAAADTLAAVRRVVAAPRFAPLAGRYEVLEVHLRRDGPDGRIASATYAEPLSIGTDAGRPAAD